MFTRLYERIRLLKYYKYRGKEPYSSLYKLLGFYPDNIQLYEQAFLHRSSSAEAGEGRWMNNERLEFLGDAILDAAVADIVYSHFRSRREGFLTNTRSKIVQRETLNRVAIAAGVDKMVRFSAKMCSHNSHMYGNALEALIGAIYLDKGYDVCHHFIRDILIKNYIDLDAIAKKEVNFKSSLIEWSQKNKINVSFDLVESFADGDGNPVFQTAILLGGSMQLGIGIGYSKKESQQNAAKIAVKKLRTDKELQQHISKMKKKRTNDQVDGEGYDDLPDDLSDGNTTEQPAEAALS